MLLFRCTLGVIWPVHNETGPFFRPLSLQTLQPASKQKGHRLNSLPAAFPKVACDEGMTFCTFQEMDNLHPGKKSRTREDEAVTFDTFLGCLHLLDRWKYTINGSDKTGLAHNNPITKSTQHAELRTPAPGEAIFVSESG